MKLQPNSKKEIKRISLGTLALDGILVGGMFLLSQFGLGTFDYRVFVGAAGGTCVAILNFTIMCLTIQKATQFAEQKSMKAFIQGSYNGRLLLQAAWIIAAFLLKPVNVLAAALPLLFPNITILYLQQKGTLVEPSTRELSPEEREALAQEDDHLESFEI